MKLWISVSGLLPQIKRWRDLGVLLVSVTLRCDLTNLICYNKWPKCLSSRFSTTEGQLEELTGAHMQNAAHQLRKDTIEVIKTWMTSRFPAAAFLEHPTRVNPRIIPACPISQELEDVVKEKDIWA